MLIQPQSIFKVLSGVPLSYGNDYSIKFASAGAQESYFNSKVEAVYTDFSYVRESRTVRVPIVADNIYKCNYCMFKNVGFGNKWFYGFITDIEYVNNGVAGVTIEVDHYQTWLFNFTLGECFVEREHVDDDTIGKHTVSEPIDFGENVVMKSENKYSQFTNWHVVIKSIPNTFGETIGGSTARIIRNQFTGGTFDHYPITNVTAINNRINELLLDGYEIVSIYMCPESFFGIQTISWNTECTRPTQFEMPTVTEDVYVPYNNKVFTFPYTFMRVINNQGGEMDLPYELFTAGNPTFELDRCYANSVSCDLRPLFEGSTRYRTLSLDNFPICSWGENAFLSYIGSTALGQLINTSLTSLMAGEMPNLVQTSLLGFTAKSQGLVKTVNNAFQTLTKKEQAKGNNCNGYVDIENNTFGYTFFRMGIKPEFARIVDQFFFRYGYAVNEYKVPATHNRSAWNYVKTTNCVVKGEIPVEAQRYICNLFDNGFTMWHRTDIGNPEIANTRL